MMTQLEGVERRQGQIDAQGRDSDGPSRSAKDQHEAVKQPKPEGAEEEIEWVLERRERLIMATLAVLTFISALDSGILTTALPALAKAFNATSVQTFWVVMAFLLTSAVFQPVISALSDIFGRRDALLGCLAFFTIGSILCTAAQNMRTLLVGRAIKGVGGGGFFALSQVITSDIIPLKQRPKIYSLYLSTTFTVGVSTSPLIGGLLIQHTTWRWLFIINFPFCAIGFVAIPLTIRFRVREGPATLLERVRYIDFVGAFLWIGGTTSFLLAITWGGVLYSWSDPGTLVPLILGIIITVATGFWERYGAKKPFLRLLIFNTRSGIAVNVCAFLQGVNLYAYLYFVVLYLQADLSKTSIVAGADLLAYFGTTILAAAISGVMITRIGDYRWAMYLGCAISALGMGLCIRWGPETNTVSWVLPLMIAGIGQGLGTTSFVVASHAVSDVKDVAYAASMYVFMRSAGIVVGIAIGETVLQNLIKKHLGRAISRDAEQYAITMQSLPVGSAERERAFNGYAKAFHIVFLVFTIVAIVNGLASLAVQKHSLEKDIASEQVLDRPDYGNE